MSNSDECKYDKSFPTENAPREAIIDYSVPRLTSLSPDVCRTPRGASDVDVPYNIYVTADEDLLTTSTVHFRGCKVYTLRSMTSCCHGDEPGTSKGTVSGTQGDVCHPITSAKAVRAEGALIIRHNDLFHMNNRNTIGKIRFVDNVNIYKTPPAYLDSYAQVVHFGNDEESSDD